MQSCTFFTRRLAEVATCISARWTSVVNDNFQLIFWTFTNPILLLMINLPKISLQIVTDQIALYLVSDCSSRYLIGVRKLFLLKIRIQFDSGASNTDNAKMILSINCE